MGRPGGCMKCYLLEKRVRLLEDLLQLRKSTSDASCQTDDILIYPRQGESSPARTVVDHDLGTAETPVADFKTEPSVWIGPDILEVDIPTISIKTEEKRTDVLFYAEPIAGHFLSNPMLEKRSTVYDKKYISLEALRGCVRELVETRSPDVREDPFVKKDIENVSDLLRFCEERLPFYRRFEVEHHYGWEGRVGIETRHRTEKVFLFRFVQI